MRAGTAGKPTRAARPPADRLRPCVARSPRPRLRQFRGRDLRVRVSCSDHAAFQQILPVRFAIGCRIKARQIEAIGQTELHAVIGVVRGLGFHPVLPASSGCPPQRCETPDAFRTPGTSRCWQGAGRTFVRATPADARRADRRVNWASSLDRRLCAGERQQHQRALRWRLSEAALPHVRSSAAESARMADG